MADYFSAGLGAVSSLFGGISGQKAANAAAKGSEAAGAAFATGAEIAGQNVELEKMSTEMQQVGALRKFQKTIGAEVAAEGHAGIVGLTGGVTGTGLSLLRESTMQGWQTRSMLGLQGEINENASRQQQASLTGQSEQAYATAAAQKAAGSSSMFGGILGAAGKIGGLLF